MSILVKTQVNGDQVEYLCEPDQSLLSVLRDKLNLTGSKEGCNAGDCGACSVNLDGKLVCSCLVLAAEMQGRELQTIEGIAEGEALHPIQQQLLEQGGFQCGVCIPGIVVAAKSLLEINPQPSEEEARYWLAGNLCRCTGYDKIIRAVMDAAAIVRATGQPGERV